MMDDDDDDDDDDDNNNNNNTPCLLSVLNCTCTLTIIESCNNTVTIFLEALSLQTTTTETNIHYHTLQYFFKQHNKTTLFTQKLYTCGLESCGAFLEFS